ncbi:hypothetical protein [Sphingomonas sp. CCH9-F2]|uniref:hypothetical protein n=1 Tax=Sphingomonas sp. CCH9-F2 TaxID=1768778 RepID=UPI0008338BF6|nr:hypothetical protein [Sphingomonas sp. CCH9-F2]
MKDWQAYVLASFAVAAGQGLRIGQKIEAGKPVTWRDIAVLATLLPAFGALGGALASHFAQPVWMVLFAGICAGWTGIGAIKLMLKILPMLLPAPLARMLGGDDPKEG